MRGRKWMCLLLCAALCLGLTAPALAAGADDQALTAVTARVKETLGLNTDAYTDFQGWAQESALLGRTWDLEWWGEGMDLSVSASDEGKVFSYFRTELGETTRPSGGLNIRRLPQDKWEQARAAAQTFLDKVLEPGLESVELEYDANAVPQSESYRFSGTILLHGLSSPISCSVTVRASDLAVTRFWRSDQSSGYLGGVPEPTSIRTEAQARNLLRSTIDLQARYVLEPDGKTAALRYVPVTSDRYYVDAQGGQLVNITQLYQQFWKSGSGASNTADFGAAGAAADTSAAAGGALTQAETEGAALLSGALDKEALDAILKNSWPEMGLERYTLTSANYSLEPKSVPQGEESGAEDYTLSCRLIYARESGQTICRKYVTVEAKTGQLKSLTSTRSYRGDDKDAYSVNTSFATAQPTADAVLKAFAGVRANVMALADQVDARSAFTWEHRYVYQQTDGTYFYPGNSYTVGIDATDGTLSRLTASFDDGVTLLTPERVVTRDQAIDAYLAAKSVPYLYVDVPVSINLAGEELMPLLKEEGYSYIMALKNGYILDDPEGAYVEGVDAGSGEAVVTGVSQALSDGFTYDDLDDHWAREAAQTLAVFSIGLGGGSLEPDRALTQLDLLTLLASVDGSVFDPSSPDEVDALYRYIYSIGLITPEQRQEDALLTRGELVGTILDFVGAGDIAALPGIYRCDFSDADSLDSRTLGCAALAQGLGLVEGGADRAFAPQRQATRAEAVVMLYRLMA